MTTPRDAGEAASKVDLFDISTSISRRASKLVISVVTHTDSTNSIANKDCSSCIDLRARQKFCRTNCECYPCMPETGHHCARRARRMPGVAVMWLVQLSHNSPDSARAPKHSSRERVSCDLRPLQHLHCYVVTLLGHQVALGIRHQPRLHLRA